MAEPRFAMWDKAFWNPNTRREITKQYEQDAANAQAMADLARMKEEYGLKEIASGNAAQRERVLTKERDERLAQEARDARIHEYELRGNFSAADDARKFGYDIEKMGKEYGYRKGMAADERTFQSGENEKNRTQQLNIANLPRTNMLQDLEGVAADRGATPESQKAFARAAIGEQVMSEIRSLIERNRALASNPLYGLPAAGKTMEGEARNRFLEMYGPGAKGGNAGPGAGTPIRIPMPGRGGARTMDDLYKQIGR